MDAEVGMQKMEDYVSSIRDIGEDIEKKNSHKNLEITKKLKANKEKCNEMLTAYSEAFDIPN